MNERLVSPLDSLSNALLEVVRVFLTPEAFPDSKPAFAEVLLVFDDGTDSSAILPLGKMNAVGLHQAIPRFLVPRKHRDAFDVALLGEVHRLIELSSAHLLQAPDGSEPCIGYAFTQSGMHQLPNGQYVFVWGDHVLGDCDFPYIVRCDEQYIMRTLPISDPLPRLFAELAYADPQMTLATVFVCATLLRSWIMRQTPSWQAVLAIVGGQGLGKTTLARRLTDWIIDSDGDPALLFSAGSTASAIRDAMVSARDLPLVVDDLCLSASPQLQRRYRDLGAQLVREGANAAPIIKKLPGGQSAKRKCAAGVILTAEFSLENASDSARCIFVPIEQPLRLSEGLSSSLIGAAYKAFIEWVIQHQIDFDRCLAQSLQKQLPSERPQRIPFNFFVLDAVAEAFCLAARDAGTAEPTLRLVFDSYCSAVATSLDYQTKLLDRFDRQRKKGNIAALLLEGLEQDAFDLCKKAEKLDRHEGIIWHRDLCLRREPLERFIRLQDGYGSYKISQIIQELKDIGALVLQEEGTAQVLLKKGTPRVYRIRKDVLKDAAEEFKEGNTHV